MAWLVLAVALSGLPQLALAVEDGIPRSGSEERRSIRSMLFGDRAATTTSVPTTSAAGACERSVARPAGAGTGSAVARSVRSAASPGHRAPLGPSKLAMQRLRALGLGASGFV